MNTLGSPLSRRLVKTALMASWSPLRLLLLRLPLSCSSSANTAAPPAAPTTAPPLRLSLFCSSPAGTAAAHAAALSVPAAPAASRRFCSCCSCYSCLSRFLSLLCPSARACGSNSLTLKHAQVALNSSVYDTHTLTLTHIYILYMPVC